MREYLSQMLSALGIAEQQRVEPHDMRLTWSVVQACRNRQAVQKLVRDVEQKGYKGLIITVDCPTSGNREQDARNHFALPDG